MIPILEGDKTLSDCVSCIINEELSGIYEGVLKYPIVGEHYGSIQIGSLITAKANDTDEPQDFRVYRISRQIGGVVSYYLEHISYELAKIPVTEYRTASPVPLQTFLDTLESHAVIPVRYSITASGIGAQYGAHVRYGMGFRSVLKSAAAMWGADIHYDNGNIYFVPQESSRTTRITYGDNLIDYDNNVDYSELYTHVWAYAKYEMPTGDDDETIPMTMELLVSSGCESAYDRVMAVDFTEKFDAERLPTYDLLRAYAVSYMASSADFRAKDSTSISFVPDVGSVARLGDNVVMEDTRKGLTIDTRIVAAEYDTLRERYRSMTVGTVPRDSSDIIGELEDIADDITEESAEEEKIVTAMDIQANAVVFTFDDESTKTVRLTRRQDGKIIKMDGVEVVYSYGTT